MTNSKSQTNTKSQASNIFLFSGEDDFSMSRKVKRWQEEFAKKYSTSAIVLIDGEGSVDQDLAQQLRQASSPSLFANKKLIILRNGLPLESVFEIIENLPKDFFLVFWQTKRLDRRLSFYKQLVKKVTVTEFNLPHGSQLNGWIKFAASGLGAQIDDEAAELLAIYLGRDMAEKDREVFNLWQAYNEVSKLASFGPKITVESVRSLVIPRLPENIFALSDQILRKDRRAAIKTFEELMSQSTLDEKSSIIKIVGLLAEQLRSLLLVDFLKKNGASQQNMADRLGWSPGRVFVTLKHSAGSENRLRPLLANLLEIDLAVKSSDQNPKLLLNLFIEKATS